MACYGCGAELSDADAFCPQCGRGRRAQVPAGVGEPGTPPSSQELPPTDIEASVRPPAAPAVDASATGEVSTDAPVNPVSDASDAVIHERASFGRRTAGWLADVVITNAIAFALSLGLLELMLPERFTQSKLDRVQLIVTIAVLALAVAYRWLADSNGGTLGKRVAGVRIVRDGTDDDAGLVLGLVRLMVSIASALPLGLGYFLAAGDAKGQTWHDKAAGTVAVRAPTPMRVLAPALLLGGAVFAAITVGSIFDLRNRTKVAPTESLASRTAEFRLAYVGSCQRDPSWAAQGVSDSGRITNICGCVADVILTHYTLDQVIADSVRLTATDPAGYTKFLFEGPYKELVQGCFRA